MNTNGWSHTRGYRTVAEPQWVDPLLHASGRAESNAVNHVCAWRNDADELLTAYATDAGVIVVNITTNEQIGYAACPETGGFGRVAELNGWLYLANDGAGVYRLDWRTLHGDGTPEDWSPFLSTATRPALLANRVAGLYAFAGDGYSGLPHAGWLALCVRLSDEGSLYNAEIVDLEEERVYHGGAWWRNMSPRGVTGVGKRLYFVCGNFVNVKYDGTAAAGEGHGWRADALACGSVSDAFDDDIAGAGWAHNGALGALVEAGGKLVMSAAADEGGGAGRLLAARNALLAGAVDLRTRVRVMWPDAEEDGWASASLYVCLSGRAEERLSLQRRKEVTNGVVVESLRALRNGVELASTEFTATEFGLRAVRGVDPLTGASTVSLEHQLDEEDPWTVLASVNDLPGGGMNVGFFLSNEFTAPLTMEVSRFAGDYAPDTAYDGAPSTDITAIAIAESPAGAAGDALFVGFESGLWGCNVDSSSPGVSERDALLRGPYAATGPGFDVLRGSDNHVRALACSSLAQWRRETYGATEVEGLGVAAVGTADGLTLISLADDQQIASFDPGTTQPLTNDFVRTLTAAAGWAYGTPDGGGWLTPDQSAPADTILIVRELSNAALLGWLRSPDDDYDHSLLYRNAATVGPLAWRVLRQDGFGGSGRVVYFRGHEAFFDRFISHDGRYDYKLTHVDRNGNESAGATATAYLDEPKVVDVTINDGAGAARSRGVSVRVSANSGDDSGNTPDEVGFVKIYEPGVNEATAPLAAYDPNKAYPYVLSSGVAGSPTPKEVAARAYSLGLRAGEPLSTIITLIDEQEAPADEIERYETFMLAWRFRGDDATPSDLNGDANYPPANLLDPCLGVKWRSADNTSAFVRLDFGAFVELRGLAILGHNFADFAGGSGSLTLTLRLTQLVDGEEVITSHDLTAQASSAMALLSLEHARIRLLTLQIDHDGDDPEAPTHFEIGRLLAIADLGVVQPRFNLADDFTWSIKEYAKLYATPSARYAVNPVNVRSARIALEDYTIDERRPLDVAFSHVGRRRPVLLLLKPELLPTLDRPDYPSNVRPEEMAIYGYLTGDSLAWRMRGVDFGSAALEIEEAAE